MGAPVVHFEITTRNAKQIQDFYTSLFGWKIDSNNPIGYGLVKPGGKRGIDGGIAQKRDETSPGVTFYAEVADPQSALDKAVSMGARVVFPVTTIPNMATNAMFADPDGNVVGVVKSEARPRTRRKSSPKKSSGRRRKSSRR